MSRLGRRLRLAWVVLALAPATLIGISLQWIALKFHLGYRRSLPVWFHRYAARIFRVRVHHIGRPSKQRPLLIVSNHVSWLDINVIGTALPLSFIAKSEVAGWPLFGLFAKLQRSVFVDRSRRAATANVNAEIAERLSAGDAIVLFAEGTTGDGNRLLPFRTALIGAAGSVIAAESHAAVMLQPLSIAYTRRSGLPASRNDRTLLAWFGDMELAPHLADTLCGGSVDATLSWGEPIAFSAGSDRKAVTRQLEEAVRRLGVVARTGRTPQSEDYPAFAIPSAGEKD